MALLMLRNWVSNAGFVDIVLSQGGMPKTFTLAGIAGRQIPRIVVPSFGFKEPPWWRNRTAEIGWSQGRNPERNKLINKATLLMRDFIETMKWQEIHFHDGSGSYVLFFTETKKDKPDRAKIAEYVTNLEYLRFMRRETKALALEVVELADR
jgi:hypothetical protein